MRKNLADECEVRVRKVRDLNQWLSKGFLRDELHSGKLYNIQATSSDLLLKMDYNPLRYVL